MGTKIRTEPQPPKRRLLTRGQAAEALGVSQATLSRWAAERTGPAFVKLGASEKAGVRYPEDSIDEFIESQMVRPK
jgi:predicted DNA-binding transcriptional regulator AlpA